MSVVASRTVISRRVVLRSAILAAFAVGAISCTHTPPPEVAAAPEVPTVEALQKTLVPGMTLRDAQEWLRHWKMEQTIYLPDRTKLSAMKPPPTGTASVLYGQRTVDFNTGRGIVVLIYLDSGYKILQTMAAETKRAA
jgi:hypothetical protein